MNKNLLTKTWLNDYKNYQFAEQTPGMLSQTSNTGICFSGGGTRALTATAGQLRGLNALGLLKKIRYISCVSGGSWASTAYTYYQEGATNDNEFLGPVTQPKDISMENLGKLDENSLGHTATKSLEKTLFNLWKKDITESELWIKAIGEIFLQPFGLYKPDSPAYFSLNKSTVADIKKRNPALADAIFHTVRSQEARPFLIINSTLVGPFALSPFKQESLVNFEYTPLYTGTLFAMDVTYQPQKGEQKTYPIGGFIEPFAFGGQAPNAPIVDATATIAMPKEPYTLAAACGTSSAAYAGFVEQHHLFGFFQNFTGLSPQELYWPVSKPENAALNFAFADGGILENYGLIPLLQRKVENIVVFINTVTPLEEQASIDKLATGAGIDTYLPPLFGHQVKYPGTRTDYNHVFATTDFNKVVQGLQEAKKAGLPVMTVTEHTTIENHWWGLAEGQAVRICWCYLDRSKNWENLLDSEIRKEIEKGNHSWLFHGPFKNFPNYNTFGENGLELLELTPEQINLLANLTCWNITSNAHLFEDMLY